ncbi:MAG: prepilin peptidase [bacterium]
MPSLQEIVVLLIGLAVGSFLNVVRYRLPRNIGFARGRSKCPNCGARIRWFDNIPVLSYIFLRGRCRDCNWRIPLIYPAVEILTAVCFLLVWRSFEPLEAVSYAVMVSLLIVCAAIDLELGIIPDRITLPGVILGLIFSLSFLRSNFTDSPLLQSALGAGAGAGVLLSIAIAYRLIRGIEGMGMGDVKLMAMIGSFLGIRLALVTILVAAVAGAIVGLFLILWKGRGLRQSLPFGVFLSPGAFFALFLGNRLVDAYMGAMGIQK